MVGVGVPLVNAVVLVAVVDVAERVVHGDGLYFLQAAESLRMRYNPLQSTVCKCEAKVP